MFEKDLCFKSELESFENVARLQANENVLKSDLCYRFKVFFPT